MPAAPPIATQLNDLPIDCRISNPAQGDIFFRGANYWNNLAAGTSGYFLKSNGPGANPSWAAVSVSPGGSSGQIQYNNSGAFGGSASLTWDGNYLKFPYSNLYGLKWTDGVSTFTIKPQTGLYFDGPGVDAGLYLLRNSSENYGHFRVGLAATASSGTYEWIKLEAQHFQSGTAGAKLLHLKDMYATGRGSGTYKYLSCSYNTSFGGAMTETFWIGQRGNTNILLANDVIGLKIQSYATQSVDPFQITQYDGTTVVYKVNKDGNPTAKSTYFFEDANGYISRTSAGNTIMFSASSATDHMKLSANYLDVLVGTALRLKGAGDTTDGVVCAADKGGNSGTGLGLLLHGGNGSYSATPTAGGYIKVYGGDGAAGNTNGGAAYVFGGAKFGSGADGNVYLGYTGSAARGTVYTYGGLTFADANNIVFDTTTGTKIGTSTSQKIGFWNATPVVQQILATGAGHTVDDVINLMQTLGLCRQS